MCDRISLGRNDKEREKDMKDRFIQGFFTVLAIGSMILGVVLIIGVILTMVK